MGTTVEAAERQKRRCAVQYLLLFAVLCVFFYLVPYTDDDLRWGSRVGAERLATGFAGYGGRYLGYLIVMAMTRSVLFKVLLMSGVFTGLVWLIARLSAWRYAPYAAVLLLLTAPLELFSSTIAWVSGYANYVTSICFTLLFLLFAARSLPRGTSPGGTALERHRAAAVLLLFLLGLVNTLIVEHVTLYNLLLALVLVCWVFKSDRRLLAPYLGYLCGCVLGACWMFSNAAYHNILSGSDTYRRVDIVNMIRNMLNGFSLICRYGYMYNSLLNLALLAVLCGLCHRYRSRLSPRQWGIVSLCLAVQAGFLVLCFFRVWLYSEAAVKGASLLSALALLTILGILASHERAFLNALFLLISIAVLDLPFLVVRPLTPRVFFGTYVLFILLLCLLGARLEAERPLPGKQLKALLLTAIGVCFVFLLAVYAHISVLDAQRLAAVRAQAEAGEAVAEMQSLPSRYEKFVHDITLYQGWELDGYKDFYGLPEDLVLHASPAE